MTATLKRGQFTDTKNSEVPPPLAPLACRVPGIMAVLLVCILSPLASAAAESSRVARPFTRPEVAPESGGSLRTNRHGRVQVDFDALAHASEVEIPLLDGTVVLAEKSEIKWRSPQDYSWTGRLRGARTGWGDVALTAKDGALSGMVFASDATYQVTPNPEGDHRMAPVDEGEFPPCGGVMIPPTGAGGDALAAASPFTSDITPATEGPHRIDVMVVYTPQAREQAGGTPQVEAMIQNAIDLTNIAFANSRIESWVYLVHSEEVAYDEVPPDCSDPSRRGNKIQGDLDWVSSDPGIAELRDTYRADMVALVVRYGCSCGLSWAQREPGQSFAPRAFQVTRLGCAAGNLSLAHEFGHVLGAEHNREDSDAYPDNASYPWSYAYWHNGSYSTIMSTANRCSQRCPRAPYFSNPDIVFNGVPTGVPGECDNSRTINATAAIVANFRQGDAFSITRQGESATPADLARGLDAVCDWPVGTVTTAVRNAEGTFKLINWEARRDGSLQDLGDSGDQGGEASSFKVDRVNGTVVTAVTAEESNLKLIAWRSEAGGTLTRLGDSGSQAGRVRQVVLSSIDDKAVTAVRDSGGNLNLMAWEVTPAGVIKRLGDSADQVRGVSDVAMTSYPVFHEMPPPTVLVDYHVITAVRTRAGYLKIIAWNLGPNGTIKPLGEGPIEFLAESNRRRQRVGEIAIEAVYPSASGGSIVATLVPSRSGNFKVITWRVSGDGMKIERLADSGVQKGQARLAKATRLSGKSTLLTALRTTSGNLKLVAWSVRQEDGAVMRLADSGEQAGHVEDIALCSLSEGRFISPVKTRSGDLNLISWKFVAP